MNQKVWKFGAHQLIGGRLGSFDGIGNPADSSNDGTFPYRDGIRSYVQGRSNEFVEAMHGLMQNPERAARGFRTSKNFIAITCLRLTKLKHLPVSAF